MGEGQYQCIISPIVSECRELPAGDKRGHTIEFNVELIFAGYTFYDKVDNFDLAFQMKTDFEKRFKILRDAE